MAASEMATTTPFQRLYTPARIVKMVCSSKMRGRRAGQAGMTNEAIAACRKKLQVACRCRQVRHCATFPAAEEHYSEKNERAAGAAALAWENMYEPV
jgi:hypothetical protein